MSEYYLKAPTSEELAVTFNGMAFADFKQLGDAQVETMRLEQHELHFKAVAEWDKRTETNGLEYQEKYFLGDPEMGMVVEESNILMRFMQWRREGVPDRDMTYDEFLVRMYHYADTRRAANPTYGKFPEEDFAKLTKKERKLAKWALYDAWEDGDSFVGQPLIGNTVFDAMRRLNITLDALADKGVVAAFEGPRGVVFDATGGYVLIGKYAAYVFSQRYPANEPAKADITE